MRMNSRFTFVWLPARFALKFGSAILLSALLSAAPSIAQQRPAQPQPAQSQQGQVAAQPLAQLPPSTVPVPDQQELHKLVWSAMLAVDQANQSGNYSVLRDMAAQGFQMNNTAAALAQAFSGLRDQRIDLANTLLVQPQFLETPRLVQANVLQARGVFQIRPAGLYFDLYFQWEQGRWKVFGLDIQPFAIPDIQPR